MRTRIAAFLTLVVGLTMSACHSQTREAKEARAKCEAGDAKACDAFATRLTKGDFVLRDDRTAATHFEQACSGGIAESCASLGSLVMEARGVTKDTARAANLYKRGCDGGAVKGCSQLGRMHLRGIGVPKNEPLAATLLQKGCDGGDMVGCAQLGRLYAAGQGVTQDFSRAAGYLKQACDKKDLDACVGLGRLYAEGNGVPQDYKRFLRAYPKIRLDLVVSEHTGEIVESGFDAAVGLGEVIERDMIAMPVSEELRMLVVGSPDYLELRGVPTHPRDLTGHDCINWKPNADAPPYRWEFTEDGRDFTVNVDARVVTTDPILNIRLALAGVGLTIEFDRVLREYIDAGRLAPVLDEYSAPFPGFYLYFPRRRQRPAALRALIDYVRDHARE